MEFIRRYKFIIYIFVVVFTTLLAGACTKKEIVKKEAPVVETPPAEAAQAPPEKVSPPPAEKKEAPKSAPEVKTAPEKPATAPKKAAPVQEAKAETPKPAKKATKAATEGIPEKYKNIDPSLLIYLSSRGVLAGTGDPTGYADDAYKVGRAEHPAALELARLPKDKFGLVDWAAAIKNGLVKPRDSLDPSAFAQPPLNLDIVIKTKSKFMPDVVFPHYTHTLWLTCTNCHTKIFQMKAGGNPEMTMPKIAAGEYCGRCHNRVAFPLADCNRCHVRPKETASSTPQR